MIKQGLYTLRKTFPTHGTFWLMSDVGRWSCTAPCSCHDVTGQDINLDFLEAQFGCTARLGSSNNSHFIIGYYFCKCSYCSDDQISFDQIPQCSRDTEQSSHENWRPAPVQPLHGGPPAGPQHENRRQHAEGTVIGLAPGPPRRGCWTRDRDSGLAGIVQ